MTPRISKKNMKYETVISSGLSKLEEYFFNCCANGFIDEVRRMIDNGIDVNIKEISNETPIVYAARHNHHDIVNLLIESRAEIVFRNQYGEEYFSPDETLLFNYCANGYRGLLIELLKKDVDIEVKDCFGWTPIMAAACHHHLDIVKILYERGAKIDILTKKDERSKYGDHNESILHAAVKNYGDYNILKYLLEKNKEYINHIDSNNDTPLTLAIDHVNVQCALLLLENGADSTLINNKAQKLAKKHGLTELYNTVLEYKKKFY